MVVNKENQNIQSHINWSDSFTVPVSHPEDLQQDFYTSAYPKTAQYSYEPDQQSSLLAHEYAGNERNTSDQNHFYLDQSTAVSDLFLIDNTRKNKDVETKPSLENPHLDYSFLLQHNQQMDQIEEGEEGEEPVIGDGARSYSSVGSAGSQKLSKDDKRKRNTAASARFRVKKKMREKALQSTASEMTDKANRMEKRMHELEKEIKWLKALIVEKDDGKLERLINDRPRVSLAFPNSLSTEKGTQKAKSEHTTSNA
ncbi:hypothetical protein BY458DRAFT_506194 [Sporodiniella umbellata]|nr:hypothetical protein BY458DRAFT_506194 [Sporodiniella umbellata]